jgi:hypothetical protein
MAAASRSPSDQLVALGVTTWHGDAQATTAAFEKCMLNLVSSARADGPHAVITAQMYTETSKPYAAALT